MTCNVCDLCKERGFLPESIINFLALLGWHHEQESDRQKDSEVLPQEIYSMEELIRTFTFNGLKRTPAILDESKLVWMNKHYFKQRLKVDCSLEKLALDLQSEVCRLYWYVNTLVCNIASVSTCM